MTRFCPFCDYRGPSPVLARYPGTRTCSIVFEPLTPVTPGHVLIVPEQHVADIADSLEITADVMAAAAMFIRTRNLGACNVITSRGAEATQTVFHFHVHIVPRRRGDGLSLPWALHPVDPRNA